MLLQVERVVLNALGRIRLWPPTFARPANHWPSSSGQADPPWRTKNSVRRCTERKNSRTRTRLGVAVLAAANASTTTFGALRSDFLSCEESCWNFFVGSLSSTSDHGGELGGHLASAKHSVYAGRVEQWPQPAPPGCGLSTSSTSLEPR
jgi:hypothetical protein